MTMIDFFNKNMIVHHLIRSSNIPSFFLLICFFCLFFFFFLEGQGWETNSRALIVGRKKVSSFEKMQVCVHLKSIHRPSSWKGTKKLHRLIRAFFVFALNLYLNYILKGMDLLIAEQFIKKNITKKAHADT